MQIMQELIWNATKSRLGILSHSGFSIEQNSFWVFNIKIQEWNISD